MASTFGLIFNNMGLNVKQSQAWSMNLVELAADLSSIHDIPLDKSLAKIHSGLVGTIEPMRQLGVVLDKQTVAQYAAANGIGKTASELTQQEKVLIRYHLMVQQSAAAQGDFARTSDEVANASRTAKSNLGNLASEVGQKLLPPVKEGLRLFNGLFTSEQEAQAADYRSRVSEIATDMRRWAGADVSEQRIQLESMFKALRETDAQGSFEAWEVFVNNYLRMGDTDLYDSVRSVNALERAHADLITTRDDVSAQATWDERKKKEEEYWEGVEKLYLGVPKLLSEYGAAERDTARDIAALRIAAKDDNVELLDERKRIQREYSTFLQGELGIEKGVADAIATIYLNDQQRMANAADLKIRKQYEVRSELGLVAQAQDTLAYGLHTEAIPAMREFAGSTDEQIEKAQELINKLNEIPLDKRIAITVEVVGMQAAVDQLALFTDPGAAQHQIAVETAKGIKHGTVTPPTRGGGGGGGRGSIPVTLEGVDLAAAQSGIREGIADLREHMALLPQGSESRELLQSVIDGIDVSTLTTDKDFATANKALRAGLSVDRDIAQTAKDANTARDRIADQEEAQRERIAERNRIEAERLATKVTGLELAASTSNLQESIAAAREHVDLAVQAGSDNAFLLHEKLADIEQLDLTTVGGQEEANRILGLIKDTDSELVAEQRRANESAERAREREEAEAQRRHEESYRQAVRASEQAVRDAEKARETAIKAARGEYKQAVDDISRFIGSFSTVRDASGQSQAERMLFGTEAGAFLRARLGVTYERGYREMAEGGIVRRPTLALIGEAGPEAVVPLSGRNAAGMTVVNNYNFHAAVGDRQSIKRFIKQTANEGSRRNQISLA